MSANPAGLAAATDVPAAASARAALQLHAAVLEAGRLQAGAVACVCTLVRVLPAQRASLALLRADGSLALLAVSDGRAVGHDVQADEALLAALAEALDQLAVVSWPAQQSAARPGAPAAAAPRIHVALRALCAPRGSAALALPLVAQGEVLGALCLEWADADARGTVDADLPEHLVAWVAPVLALMQANERPWRRRLLDAAQAWLRSADQPQRRRWRALLPLGTAAAGLLLLWPATWHVGGAARLEGAVQRVLAAPADGFIQQVHARPGQAVRAGQPLMELADRDLQLERQRWQSQLAQQLEGLAAAQARADRAALAQHQGKADEAQAQLDLVDEKLARSRLLAPFDGIVVQGDWAQQLGAPVKQGAELMTVAPQGAYRVIVEVDERDVGELRLGQPGSLALSALPWQTLPLQVTRVAPVARAVDGRNVFEVEAALPAAPQHLQPGLLGQAHIDIGTAPLAWQALRRVAAALRLVWWRWVG